SGGGGRRVGGSALGDVTAEQLDEGRALKRAVEGEVPAQLGGLRRVEAGEAVGVELGEGLGEQDVAHEHGDVRATAPRPRVVVGELAVEERVDRVEDVPHARV